MRDKYVFISYKSDEMEIAEEVKLTLERNGISAWMDKSEIMAGENYAQRIDEALRGSSAIVLVLSNMAMSSAHIKSELTLALTYSKPIYAYVIEECEPNAEFNFDLPAEKRYEAFKNKDEAINNLISYLKAEIESDDQDPYDVAEFFKKRRRYLKDKREKQNPHTDVTNSPKPKRQREIKLYKAFPLNLTPYSREYSKDEYVRLALHIHTVLVLGFVIAGALSIARSLIPIPYVFALVYALAVFVLGENLVGLVCRLIGKVKSKIKVVLISVVTVYVCFWIMLMLIMVTIAVLVG